MEYLFTYGTLQNSKIQKALFKKTLTGSIDSLKGYTKKSIILGNNTYPILFKSDNTEALIKGSCYQISNRELLICDEYEGDSYKRILLELNSKKKAWVYVANT